MGEKSSSLNEAQSVVRAKGQTTCVHHRQTHLDWLCETCSVAICASCISTIHKGHTFSNLSELTPENKQKIITFINKIEENELTHIQQEINSTNENLKKHLSHFEGVAKAVRIQGEKLKEELDLVIAQTLSRVKNLEEESSRLLINYKKELEKKHEKLKSQLKQCKESLQIGTDIQLFDLAKGLDNHVKLPNNPSLGNANFIANKTPERFMEQAFGKLTLVSPNPPKVDSDRESSSDAEESTVASTQYERFPTQPSNDDRAQISPVPPPNVSPQATIPEELKAQCNIRSICPDGVGGIWLHDYSKLIHLTNQGNVQHEIDCLVTDICTTPYTHTLWACSKTERIVMKLTSGTLTCILNTKDEPICICVTAVEHILVGTARRITEYIPGGITGHTSTTTQSGKPVVCSPRKISQCALSKTVAVLDLNNTSEGGDGMPHVLVLDEDLHQLYKYGPHQHPTPVFDPVDLTYDSHGRLVIIDSSNCCLHLLSGDAKYLRLLHTDAGFALCACVATDGVLYAVFGFHDDQVIKRLQYTT